MTEEYPARERPLWTWGLEACRSPCLTKTLLVSTQNLPLGVLSASGELLTKNVSCHRSRGPGGSIGEMVDKRALHLPEDVPEGPRRSRISSELGENILYLFRYDGRGKAAPVGHQASSSTAFMKDCTEHGSQKQVEEQFGVNAGVCAPASSQRCHL